MAKRKNYTVWTIRSNPIAKTLEVTLIEEKTDILVTRKVYGTDNNYPILKSLKKGDIILCTVDCRIRNVEKSKNS